MKYVERLFSRLAFIEALTPSEKLMRKCLRERSAEVSEPPGFGFFDRHAMASRSIESRDA